MEIGMEKGYNKKFGNSDVNESLRRKFDGFYEDFLKEIFI